MSCTLTPIQENTSPKRRRITADDQSSRHYSSRELHSWTFSTESIARCTINDALSMQQNMVDGVPNLVVILILSPKCWLQVTISFGWAEFLAGVSKSLEW